jgi:SAM-dependent methyltransferase
LTWHYGLVARWWAEFNTDGVEIAYFRTFIERFGQPVLDAACGTGRLLIPYLNAGLEVDGCDVSSDMLDHCRSKAGAEGHSPHLYLQALHELDVPRSYRTIVLCGAFGLGGSRTRDEEALHRLRRHLVPGGALVLDSYLPYKDADEWKYWTRDGQKVLPEPWPAGSRRATAGGDELELLGRLYALDPLAQVATRQIRARLWHDGEIVREEEHTLLERLYFRDEVLQMLRTAGFSEVEVFADYTKEPAAADAGILIYVATAPTLAGSASGGDFVPRHPHD